MTNPLPPPNPGGTTRELLRSRTASPESGSPYFDLAAANRGAATTLTLWFRTGNALSLGYPYLHAVEFDPSDGVRLHFTGHQIEVRGTHLESLFHALSQHKVQAIRESLYTQLDRNCDLRTPVVLELNVLEV